MKMTKDGITIEVIFKKDISRFLDLGFVESKEANAEPEQNPALAISESETQNEPKTNKPRRNAKGHK